jgi:hypothetical protein
MNPAHILFTALSVMLMMIVLTPFIKAFFLAFRSCIRSIKKTFDVITNL